MFIATRGTSDNDETSRGIQRWQYNSMFGEWEFHYVIRTGLADGETVVSLEYDGDNIYCVTGDANGTTENNRLLAINPTNDFNNDNLCDNGFVEIAQAGANRKFTSVMLPAMPSIVAAEFAPRLSATCFAYRERGLGVGNIRVGLNRVGAPFNWTQTNNELDFEGNVADYTANKYGTGHILMTYPNNTFTGIGFGVARTPYRTSTNIEFSDGEEGPAGYEPRAIAVTENGIVGVLLDNGDSAMVQTFNPDLSTAALHDNGGAGFAVSGQTPINIAPRGNASFAVLFGGENKGAFVSLNAATGASTPSGSYTIPSGGAGITMTPLDIRFDTSLRAIFLNVGTEPNQNLLRLDSAPAGNRTFTAGTAYRRDEIGVGGQASPTYRQRAIGLTIAGDTPMVTMMGLFGGDATLFEPADDQQIPGSGKMWTMGGPNYSYTRSSFRMAPGYAPLDFPF